MKLTELEVFEEPTLKDVMEMSDDYIIDTRDFDIKYWKTYHYQNLIYPLRTIFLRYKYNTTNGSKYPNFLRKLVDKEVEMFIKDVLNINDAVNSEK